MPAKPHLDADMWRLGNNDYNQEDQLHHNDRTLSLWKHSGVHTFAIKIVSVYYSEWYVKEFKLL